MPYKVFENRSEFARNLHRSVDSDFRTEKKKKSILLKNTPQSPLTVTFYANNIPLYSEFIHLIPLNGLRLVELMHVCASVFVFYTKQWLV